jgi:hypothetical protein
MTSPTPTLNDLMRYLREQYHLNAPVLPFAGMSAALIRLWHMAVDWFPSKLPPHSKIAVEGEWQVTLPSGDTLGLTDVYVNIGLASTTSP